MLKLIIWLGLRYSNQFIKLLAKLEYNNAIYLKKLADKAKEDNYFNLSDILLTQSKEEELHGKALSCLIDGKNKFNLVDNGYWQSLTNRNGSTVIDYYDKNDKSIDLSWGNIKGSFVQLDGVSQRYISAKWFFKNKKASEYSWEDQLAFMTILEKETAKLYSLLGNQVESPLQRLSVKFAKEEQNHQTTLYYTLSSFTSIPNYYIDKWSERLFVAKLGLLLDIIYFLYKNTKIYAR